MKKEFVFSVEKIEVSFNGVDFFIDPDMPVSSIKKLMQAQKMTENDYEKNVDFITASIKEYLYAANPKKKVDEFVDGLKSILRLKVYTAIMQIVSEAQKTEIEEKKTELK